MTAIISMLRGINMAGYNRIKMDDLRKLYESLKLQNPQTYVQSGNVVFTTSERSLPPLAKRIEDAVERKFGFRAAVILRTAAEMRTVISRNPFAGREELDPSKLAVIFLADDLRAEQRKQLAQLDVGPEEMKIYSRELYIYFPDGMGRSKLPALVQRTLKKTGTGRNWNSVTRLLQMAEAKGA